MKTANRKTALRLYKKHPRYLKQYLTRKGYSFSDAEGLIDALFIEELKAYFGTQTKTQ